MLLMESPHFVMKQIRWSDLLQGVTRVDCDLLEAQLGSLDFPPVENGD